MFEFIKKRRVYKLERDFQVREKRMTVTEVLMKVLLFLVVTVSLSLVYYVIFALIFDSDVEKQLKSENEAYEQRYQEMVVRLERLEDVTSGLENRDDRLYEKIFHTNAPFDSRIAKVSLLELGDSIAEKTLEATTARRIDRNEERARAIEADFRRIYELTAQSSFVCPPMKLPLKNQLCPDRCRRGDEGQPVHECAHHPLRTGYDGGFRRPCAVCGGRGGPEGYSFAQETGQSGHHSA